MSPTGINSPTDLKIVNASHLQRDIVNLGIPLFGKKMLAAHAAKIAQVVLEAQPSPTATSVQNPTESTQVSAAPKPKPVAKTSTRAALRRIDLVGLGDGAWPTEELYLLLEAAPHGELVHTLLVCSCLCHVVRKIYLRRFVHLL